MMNMHVLPSDFESAKFHGFTLKPGFLYGYNLRGQAIASSGWTYADSIYLYTKTEAGWKPEWVDIDRLYQLGNPELREWIEKTYGDGSDYNPEYDII